MVDYFVNEIPPMTNILYYLLSCFILIIPVVLWNVLFASSLPKRYAMDVFWEDIPSSIGTTENVLRLAVFVIPLLMPLSFKSDTQKMGLAVFIIGVLIYFSSWLLQINFPESSWSKSVFGFMAPAYTPIIWFVGIGMIGETLFVKIPYHPIVYIGISALFVVFHSLHSYIVYVRLR